MGKKNVLKVEPPEIKFQVELHKHLFHLMELRNPSPFYASFKFQTTAPQKFRLKPSLGLIAPQQSEKIRVVRQPLRRVPNPLDSTDRFLLLTETHSEKPETAETLFHMLLNKSNWVHQLEIKVKFEIPIMDVWNGIITPASSLPFFVAEIPSLSDGIFERSKSTNYIFESGNTFSTSKILEKDENRLPEKKMLDRNLPQKNLPEENMPGKRLPEKNLRGKNLPEKSLPEKKLPEKKLPEKKLPGKKSSKIDEILEEEEEDEREEIDEIFYPKTLFPLRPNPGSPFIETGIPKPSDDSKRLACLRKISLLNAEEEERFDRITRLTADIFQVPVCILSVLGEKTQFNKSRFGLSVCEIDRNFAFCGFALLPSPEPIFVVENLAEDSRTAKNKLVTGPPHVLFYAGSPLLLNSGFIVGTLCVVDMKPKKFSLTDRQLLLSLSRLAVMEIEQRTRFLERLENNNFEKRNENKPLGLSGVLTEGLIVVNMETSNFNTETLTETEKKMEILTETEILYVNEGWEEITGYSFLETVGTSFFEFLKISFPDSSIVEKSEKNWKEGKSAILETKIFRKDKKVIWIFLEMGFSLAPAGSSYARQLEENTTNKRFLFGVLKCRL